MEEKNINKNEKEVNAELNNLYIVQPHAYEGNKNIVVAQANNAVSVGKNAFANCENLKEIYFGADIRIIDSMAFANCPNLTDVWFPMLDREAMVAIANNAFPHNSNICFHVFGLSPKGIGYGNKDIEKFAIRHHFHLTGMI